MEYSVLESFPMPLYIYLFRVLWKAEKDHVYFRLQAKTKESDFAALGFVDPSSRVGKTDSKVISEPLH